MRTLDPFLIDQDVTAAVDSVLRDILGRRQKEAEAVDSLFAADIADRVARFTSRGGRRLRPQFVWWGMRACGGDAAVADVTLRVAGALELVQTCALIQDDVMDGSPLRRGRPSVHVDIDAQYGTQGRERPCGTFGRAAAVLAGDLALAWADDSFAEAMTGTPSAGPATALWRAMRTEMVAGQYLDLHAQATADHSPAQAVRAAMLKTATYSVERPLMLGATLASGSATAVGALGEVGREAGVAFQLHDDLQGAFGDADATGKSAGEDLRGGKSTYLLAVARERCEARGDRVGIRVLDRVLGARSEVAEEEVAEEEVQRVLELLITSGARDRVVEQVEQLCSRSEDALERAGLDPAATARIGRLLREACGRSGGNGAQRIPGSGPVCAGTEGARIGGVR
ncbi:polyprenyl synthetase family protein [Streptomyces sp. NPDC058745]|uniref:polyprenyl synthetase family protein n=1 Tax=Streptomyces sp. NPDC058745 TaxID=3346621 RepID=UPI00368491CA